MSAPNSGTKAFDVLSVDLLSPGDLATIVAALGKLPHPSQAREAAPGLGMAATALDPRGRCVVLLYKGVEVALLFQRITTRYEIIEAELAPSVFLKTLDDAWVMFDLTSIDQHLTHQAFQKTLGSTQEQLTNAQSTIVHLQRECDAKGYAISGLEKRIEDLKAKWSQGDKLPPDKPITVTPFPDPLQPLPVKSSAIPMPPVSKDPPKGKKRASGASSTVKSPVKKAKKAAVTSPAPIKAKATKKVAKKASKLAPAWVAAPPVKKSTKKVVKKVVKKVAKKK